MEQTADFNPKTASKKLFARRPLRGAGDPHARLGDPYCSLVNRRDRGRWGATAVDLAAGGSYQEHPGRIPGSRS